LTAVPRTVAEVDGFITMLLSACENDDINRTLEMLLALPDEKRRGLVHSWVNDLLIAQAPQDFIQAVACLLDDAVAEKAYEVIYRCRENL